MHHAGAGRQHLGLFEHIGGLPVEVVVRHGQQHLLAAVRVERPELRRLAPVVRVGQQVVDQNVAPERALGGVAVRLGVGGNADPRVHQHGARELVLGWLVIEEEAELGAIRAGLAVRRVVHLEDEGGPGRQQGAGAVRVRRRDHAGHVAAEAAARPPARIRPFRGGQHPAGDHVVQGGPVAGQDFSAAHPDILRQRILHGGVLVLDDAGGRHVERRDVEHQVRRTHLPLGPIAFVAGERVLALAARRTGLHPPHQRAHLLDAERTVVGEVAVHGIRVPRRHPPRAHDFADHRRETAHDGVVRHRPRADAAVAVAGDAVRRQERRDVVHVGGRIGSVLAVAGQAARASASAVRRHGFAGEQGIQGGGEIARAPMRQAPPVGVHQQRLAGARESQGRADDAGVVQQDRQRHLAHNAAIGETIRVHQGERDALFRIGAGGALETLHMRRGLRAARGVRHQGDRARVREIVQFVRLTVLVQEREVLHPGAHVQCERGAGDASEKHCGRQPTNQAHGVLLLTSSSGKYGAEPGSDQSLICFGARGCGPLSAAGCRAPWRRARTGWPENPSDRPRCARNW